MAVKPILYSAPMVRALLAGTKTQTRRLLNPQPPEWATFCQEGQMYNSSGKWVRTQCWYWSEPEQNPRRELRRWPVDAEGEHYWMRQKYSVGDILWVRETCRAEELTDGTDGVRMIADGSFCPIQNTPKAAIDWLDLLSYRGGNKTELVGQTVTSIHMPRWASRLTQVVTDVRVQRLQDITEEDARAEGVSPMPSGLYHCGYDEEGEITCRSPVTAFAWLWNDLNGPDAWGANPWVAAYTFETHLANVDAFLAGRGTNHEA